MRNYKLSIFATALLIAVSSLVVSAQEEESTSLVSIDAGADIYTSYVWRGAKFGTGPAFQPWVESTVGGLAIGAWGSVNSGIDEAFEMDLYISYSFDFGLSLAVTDYYFGHVDGDSIGVDDDGFTTYEQLGFLSYEEAHFIEPAVSYEIGDLSLMAAYMFVPESELIDEGDMYFEAGYAIGDLSIAVGAGDGAYTDDGDFNVCNITLGTSKEIKITDSFSLPLSGAVTLNPTTEGFFIYAGVSF
jgi:hypothetical protein